MTNSSIADALHQIADVIETKKLRKRQIEVLVHSIIPALDNFVCEDGVDFFNIMAFGEDVFIHDWAYTDDAPLFDIAGRLTAFANTISGLAQEEEMSQITKPDCQDCDNPACPGHPDFTNDDTCSGPGKPN